MGGKEKWGGGRRGIRRGGEMGKVSTYLEGICDRASY